MSVCLPLSLSPLAFPLIFNKQQLRLSATGRQFVPTTKNHGNNHWKSLSASKGPPSLASLTRSALWALCKFGWNGRLESISKWGKTWWEKFGIKRLHGLMFAWESISRCKSFIRSSLEEKKGDCSTTIFFLVERRKWNLKKWREKAREWGSSLSVAYTVLPLLTILTRLLLMIQLCLHPSLLPPTPTSCF